ncbi:MAG: DUF5312 family protein [Treponema sp.]|jgi:hypothetical protein|nr:DUF5312 family protein [Treponema sp.]
MAEDLMDKVFSFFSGDTGSDEKTNMLKQIGRELSQNKFSKYFRVRTEEIDPSLASYLFYVYKTIYPIKVFLQDDKKQAQLKQVIIEACIDSNILETIKRLDPASLDSKAREIQPDDLINSIKADVEKLTVQFDRGKRAAADRYYEMASNLNLLINFNFYALFRKFDPHFADGSFIIEPKFPVLKTVLVTSEIGEFLSVTQSLKPEDEWNHFLGFLRKCSGHDLVTPEQFYTMVKSLRELHASKILELMVQYTLRNPVWVWKPKVYRETLGEDWLTTKREEADNYIRKINHARKTSQINALTRQIFEAADLVRLENYTVQLSEPYRIRELETFKYAEGLNYLKAFLDDYLNKEIKELCDILLIRGQWTNNILAREMSQALNSLIEASQPINDLDIVMSEDGGDGSRLRAAMLRIDRDRTQARYVNSIVSKNNNDALEIINEAAQDLIVIGKHLKSLIDDVQKKHPELLINWREINLASKEPIAGRMIEDFKHINYFVQLMHLCTQ